LDVGRSALAIVGLKFWKDRFGESPKPARESRALPRFGGTAATEIQIIAALPPSPRLPRTLCFGVTGRRAGETLKG